MLKIKTTIRKNPLLGPLIRRIKLELQHRRWSTFDEKALEFYAQFIHPGDLCFDIGANMGNRTKIFLKLKATVVAVEPQHYCLNVLRQFYGRESSLKIVCKAVGATRGWQELMVGDETTLSSMSKEWIANVKQSGRFADHQWNERHMVEVTTMDDLIAHYGHPNFIKLDIEGYEYQALCGLNHPVKCLSFEFTPEWIDSTLQSIARLETLGRIRLNFSLGESMRLVLGQWETADKMGRMMTDYRSSRVFGDVYVRFVDL